MAPARKLTPPVDQIRCFVRAHSTAPRRSYHDPVGERAAAAADDQACEGTAPRRSRRVTLDQLLSQADHRMGP